MKSTLLMFTSAIATFICAKDPAHDDSVWSIGQIVHTSSGPVEGHAAQDAPAVSEYLGIPYAKPPIGSLRFAAPRPYHGSSAINGTSFGYTCPGTSPFAIGSGDALGSPNANITAVGVLVVENILEFGEQFSEDCLTLNVWTAPQKGEKKKAVLVWIYGGGFTTGSSAAPLYNGQHLADLEDVVVVSINYRITIFGFPGNPEGPLNPGLLDQRLAVEWVRENIEAFGGDIERITLFGQSAGGASVDYYSYAWTEDPIVAGLVSESGTVNGLGQYQQSDIAQSWFNVSSTLGCGDSTSNSGAVLTCMQTKSFTSILAAIPPPTGSAFGSSYFGPTIDDVVVFSDYPSRSTIGNFIKKPYLLGNTDYEAGLFVTIALFANQTYPSSFWDSFDLSVFSCPSAVRANISVANRVPTWRYRWFGAFPNTRLTTFPDSGAWHASELAILLGNTFTGPGIPPWTEAEVNIGNYMRGAWAAFAKNPEEGLRSYRGGWPIYDPGDKTLIRLAYENRTGTNLAFPLRYDAACPETFPVEP